MAERTAGPQVIVGVDGSDASFAALEWAVPQARRRGAGLQVVSCYSVPFYGEPGMFGAYAIESQVESIKTEHEDLVAKALARVGELDPAVHADGFVTLASPAVAIPEMAEPGDQIVIGTTGRTGVIADTVGSVATAICHKARVPVVVVPAKSPGRGMSMKKIVVGVDGSPTSEEALRWAFEEAKLAGAELVVVHAWSYPYPGWRSGDKEPRDDMKVDALRQLEASIDALGHREGDGVQVHANLVEDSAAKALIDEAASADLVVVGSRGRGGLKSMLLGSVSRAVVQHAPCPVAVIRHSSD
jgi:nucleotide-binding universal stress UspA family protein